MGAAVFVRDRRAMGKKRFQSRAIPSWNLSCARAEFAESAGTTFSPGFIDITRDLPMEAVGEIARGTLVGVKLNF